LGLDTSRIKALCFDVDGTLRDTDDQYAARIERLLNRVRFILPGRETKSFARWTVMGLETPGNLAYQLLDRLDLDDNLERMLVFLNRMRKHSLPSAYWIVQGVDETLHKLNSRYPMAVISARDEAGTRGFLQAFSLSTLFIAVATSQTCRYTKPFPEPVLWAAKEMGIDAHEILMIGDTTVDIRAGKAAGAQTVGVLCGFGHESELRRAGADLILPSPVNLSEVLLPT
jgi:N-acetyl-D-muramate 6-phosphate phosphatase